jgi:lysozyme
MTKEDRAVELIKSLEGFRAEAYLDSAGVITIGYGLAKKYLDDFYRSRGPSISLGDTCTEEMATEWLKDYLEMNVFSPLDAMYGEYQFNDNIYVAVSSLVYNEGWACVKGVVLEAALALTYHLNHSIEALNALAAAFRLYNKIRDKDGNLVVCQGLVNRREKEIAIFLKPEGF